MGLNEAKGNMYDFITHTWNTIKGHCPHECSYCYMKRFGKQRPVRFDGKEMKTDLGDGSYIFVGSSCDMFAEEVSHDWIMNTLTKMNGYKNKYLLQSKNPARFARGYTKDCNREIVFCTTIETNYHIPSIMGHSPAPIDRSFAMGKLENIKRYVTIEPVMAFNLAPMVEIIKRCEPIQVNIGADSGNNGLPEPNKKELLYLIDELSKFTTIARKTNLKRILDV